ncbi:MAG: LacI family DNA-binding transcriptional regulator [Rhodobacteraceae bacterium]|nr:LacI family DNA-binding transcriptional regulator [Paracoccaceae bacterium]
MEDFSEAIGLSRPTVSRYFKDPQSVRRSTRKIIEDGVEQHSYRPNFYAANLTRRKIRAIGIIVPSIIDPFYSELVNTIEIFAEEHGYLTILQCSHSDPKTESHALERLKSMNLTGIAMASLSARTDIRVVENTLKSVPIVFMDSRPNENLSYIGTNNRHSVSMMVDYLCRSGTPPVFFGMPPLNSNIIEREKVYFESMQKLGFEPRLINPDPIPVKDNFERFGYEQFLLLSKETIPKGSTIFCVNDRVAFGLLAAAAKLGLKVGKGPENDLRVAGHDDQHFSKFTNPSLTTVAQNTKQIGIFTAQALLNFEGSGTVMTKDHLIDGTILFRDSA